MATPTPDSYESASGTPIYAGRWAAADYAATLALSSDAGSPANPDDVITFTVNINSTGANPITNARVVSEVADGNLVIVPNSVTTDVGTITQQDTRIQVDIASLPGAGVITYQATVAAAIPTPHYVSNLATLTGDQIAPEIDDLVMPVDAGTSNLLLNGSFESPVTAVDVPEPADNWSGFTVVNSSTIPPLDGVQVGVRPANDTIVNFQDVTTPIVAGEVYRFEISVRADPDATDLVRDIDTHVKVGTNAASNAIEQRRRIVFGQAGAQWATLVVYFSTNETATGVSVGLQGVADTDLKLDTATLTKLDIWHPAILTPYDSASSTNKRPMDAGAGFYVSPETAAVGLGISSVVPQVNDECTSIHSVNSVNFDYRQVLEAASVTNRPKWGANGRLVFDGVSNKLISSGSGYSIDPGIEWHMWARLIPRNDTGYIHTWISNEGTGIFWRALTSSPPGALIYRDGTNKTILSNFLQLYENIEIMLYIHCDGAGQAHCEINGTVYGAIAGAAIGITERSVGNNIAGGSPAYMDYWGTIFYAGPRDTQLDTDIQAFLNNLGT